MNTEHKQGIYIVYYNARSLLSKIDELRLVYEAMKPDVICVVETWLDNDIVDNELILPNCQLFRKDRNRQGGGVAIYVSDALLCNVLVCGGPRDLEFISVSIASSVYVCPFFIAHHHHQSPFLMIFVQHFVC